MRVGIYARFSSEKQARGYSIKVQLDVCRQAAPAGAEIVEYVDRAASGRTVAGRRALRRLLNDAKAGRLDLALVYKFDRLGRNQAEMATLIADLEEGGVEVRSATEGADRLARGIHLVIGEHFSRQLGERTHAGVLRAAAQGRIGGPAPFGYEREENGRLRIEPGAAGIVRRIFERRAAGVGLRAIARELNTAGMTGPRGEWSASCLVEMVRNEVYVGRRVFNKRRFRRDRRTGKRVFSMRPREDWTVQTCAELRIVGDELWGEAQARARGARRGRPTRYALSGLIRCGECGARFVAQKSRNAKGSYVYLVCGGRRAGRTCGNGMRLRHDLLLREIWRRIEEEILNEGAMAALKGEIGRALRERLARGDSERVEAEAGLGAARRRVEVVKGLMLGAAERGDGTEGIWVDELAAAATRVRALEARLMRAPAAPTAAAIAHAVERGAARLRALMVAADGARVREALGAILLPLTAGRDGTIKGDARPAGMAAVARKVGSGGLLPELYATVRIDINYRELRRLAG